MPRNVPTALQTHLEDEATTLAALVKITRRDGQVFGFTSADRQIVYQAVTYEALDGLNLTAAEESVTTGVNNVEAMGFFSSGRITEDDLRAGMWDGARIQVLTVNYVNLGHGHVVRFTGLIGEVGYSNGEFRAEVRSLAQQLKQTILESTSKTCRVRRLGDARCKVALAGNTVGGVAIQATRSVASASGSGSSVSFASDLAPTGHYAHGIVKMTSGPNSGIEREIKSHTLTGGAAVLTLRRPFPFALSVGETGLLTAGCDRLFTTCVSKYANANNFRGEDQLPGNDQMLRIGRPPRS